ncbi:MAG: hypothetical protein ACN6O3_02565 [Comamonas sp.]
MVEVLVSQAGAQAGSAYQARDVVNAPHIKARIRERSAARGDAPEITAWLGNHFYRHVVGNLQAEPPALQPIADGQALAAVFGRQAPPGWVLERLEQQSRGLALPRLWWVDPDAPVVLALEARLVEFLSTRQGTSLEGKLQRVNCPQALARWTLEHLAFAQKQSRGWVEHTPAAVRGLLPGQHGSFVEFDGRSPQLRQEMAYESQMMGHCVGQFADRKQLRGGYGEHYAEACEQGRMRLFSYRTGQAQPRITVNAQVQKDGSLQVEQIKGKQNRPPIARYAGDVVALLNHLQPRGEEPDDAIAMGVVRRPAHLLPPGQEAAPWCAVAELHTEAEQLWLLAEHPDLLPRLDLRSPLLQWMVAARKDEVDAAIVEHMPKTAALQQALELAKKRERRARTVP